MENGPYPGLERENRLALYVVQALIGMITPNYFAVSVRFEQGRIVVVFWLRERSAETDDDIEEIIADVDAYMGNEECPLEAEVHVGAPPAQPPTRLERMVYRAKD